jgi:hypothetical protein
LNKFPVEEPGSIYVLRNFQGAVPDYIPPRDAFGGPPPDIYNCLVDVSTLSSLSELQLGDTLYFNQKENEKQYPRGNYRGTIGQM